MMNKSLLAAAVAAAFTAPTAHAVDFDINDDTTLSIYGTVEPKIISETDANGDDSTELDDEDSTLGLYAEHRFSDNVTGFGQLEFQFDTTGDTASTGQDDTFAGLKGSWGKVQAGNFDSVYEDLIIDATEVAEDAEISDEATASEDNMIAYYSPSFNGFSFRAQGRIQGRDEAPANDQGNEVGFAIAGGYTADNWGVYVGHDDRGAETVTDPATGNQVFADQGTTGVSGIFGVDNLEFGAKYAVQDLEDNDPRGDDITFTALRATVELGRTELYGAVQNVDLDEGDDRDEVTVGVSHSVWSNLSVWAEAGQFDQDNDAGDNAMVGAIFSF